MVVQLVQALAAGELLFDMKNALVVFVKNLMVGKVKTRLAATVGDDKALRIYRHLLNFTYHTINNASCDKFVFYSDWIQEKDVHSYSSRLQSGGDLGTRMKNAFVEMFSTGYQRVVIVGSDSLEITSAIINKAFDSLVEKDIVVGPASDGGYYLLGMKYAHKELFDDIQWSSPLVLERTLQKVKEKGLIYEELDKLHDIDEEKDWLLYESKIAL